MWNKRGNNKSVTNKIFAGEQYKFYAGSVSLFVSDNNMELWN